MSESPLRRFGVWPLVTLFVMVAIGVVLLVPGLVVSWASALDDPIVDRSYGTDLRAFMGAGELAAERNGEALYDPDDPVYVASGAARYVNPPWYAIAMIPISFVPFDVLWIIWAIVGLIVLGVTLHRLDLARADRWVAGAFLSLAGILTVFYGQNAFFMAAILAIGVGMLGRSAVGGGTMFALAAFKPHLLLGYVVWWLSDLKTWWRVVVWASVATAVLVGVSFVWLPGSWEAFFDALANGDDLVVTEREVSLVSAIRLLFGDSGGSLYAFVGLAAVGVISALIIGLRQVDGNARLGAALAMSASLLLTPRALAYDWILLLVAFALLVGAGVVRTPTLVAWAAALGAVLSIGVFLIDLQVEEWGRAISIAPLTLLVAFFLLVARIGKWSAARRVPADSP